MSNSGEQHQGLATSSISEAGGRMSLSSTESFEKMSPRYISISRASDTPTSDEILSTTPTSIRFPPNAPQAEVPCPSDPKVVKNIEVLAAFVAKNGPQFEDMAREKQAKDPNFQFLFGGEAGSEAYIAHNFYEWKKRQLLSQEDMSPLQEHQKLNPESHVRSETLKPDSQRSLRSDASEMHNDEIDQILPSPQPKLIKAQENFSCSTLRNDGDTFEQQRLPLDDFSTRRRDARRRTGFDRQSMKDVDTLPDLLRPVKDSVPSAVNKEERSLVCDDPHIGTSAKYSEALEQRKPAEMISHLEEKQSCHRYNDDKEANLQTPQVQTFGHSDANSFQKRNDPTRDAERSTRTMHIGRPNIRNPVKSSQSGPHTIDEFGRLVRQGVNDSDSDEDHHSFRKRQRSPSGSRSRSPGGSRRMWQSPSWSPRRRGNYHGSYSRSPKQHRSHSPTPPWDVKRGSDWRGDQGSFGRGRRGGRRGDPVQPCYDFSRGRCFRGSSCRFIHQDAHMTFSEGRDRVSGGNKDYRRRDNFMDHEGTYTSKDVVWSSASRVAPRIQRAANVTGGEGWGWPNKAMEGSENKNDGFKVDEGFSTQDHENTTISGPISAAFTAEAISNSTKPSFPAPLSDDSQMALSSCSWGMNTNRQPSPVQASQLSTFANEQISPLSSNSRVSFHPPQTLPFLPPPPFPPPSPNLPPPPPPLLAPRIPPPPPPPPALTPIAIFSAPTCAPGVPASLPGADQLFDHSPICFGRPLSSNMPVSLNSVSQQPVAAGAPPASFPAVSVVVPLHQHATHVTLLSAQTGAEMPGSHDAVLISLSEEPRLPSPTPASQLPFNNVFPQRQGFAPISSSLPQYAPGVSKQQETAAPNYTTSFSGMVSHQQKDGGHLSFSKNSTLASNPSQEVPPHQFTNSSHSGTTEIMNSHSKALLEPPSTNQHLSTADMINLSAGPCTQSFTSASGAVAVTHNPRDSSDTAMDVLPQITSKGVPSSSLTHTSYIAKSIDEPADGDVRSQSSGASFEQVMPSLTRSSLGMGLKLSEVDTEPVCPEEPMSPGPAVSGMHTLNPEPPSDLVMENVSPGLPARMTQHDPNTSQQLTLVIGNSTAEKDSSTLEIQNNSPDNVQALPVEHGLERASLNLEDAQERLKKDKEGKPVMLLRVAVTEYVKEVLKPTWKEGHMSKEAFKTIAKKAVDKVLGTLQSHQVPKTQDKVDHFMSFSRPKIANLVQGYVEKYVKIT